MTTVKNKEHDNPYYSPINPTVMKKNRLFLIILMMAMMLAPDVAMAYDFESGGIYYNITGNNTVSVTYKDTNLNSYSGTVNIPAKVTHEGVQYNVTAIGSSAFRQSPDLTSVTIPYGVQTIGYASFYMCTGLTSVSIPNSVTLIDYFAFRDCSSLTSIFLPNSVTTLYSQVFQNCTALKNVTLPNGITFISAGLFMGCSSLESIIIPNSVTEIGMYAFNNCTSLTDITFSDATYYVSSDAFDNTPWLENLPDGVLYAGKVAFSFKGLMEENCHLTLKPGTISIGARAFYGHDALAGITIPSSVHYIGNCCLSNCYNLKTIVVESGNTTFDSRNNCNAVIETATNKLCIGCKSTVIPNSVTGIGNYAFYECEGLTSVNLREGITSIGEKAFNGCSFLNNVTIPASVNSIGKEAFAECFRITGINVASGNTTYDSRNNCNAIIETATDRLIAGCAKSFIPNDIAVIGEWAFYGQFYLQTIRIPSSVTAIEDYAFNYTVNLLTLICEATTPPATTGTTFFYISHENGTLYVPRASIEAYQNDQWWGRFEDIRAIEDLLMGDIDGDGNVRITDISILINMFLSGQIQYNYCADLNGDGTITITDVVMLINLVMHS